MRNTTIFLMRFAITSIVLTVIFRFVFSYFLDERLFDFVYIPAVIYGLGMVVNSFIYLINDSDYLPIYDMGFRFHLATYFIFNLVSELWFLMGLNSSCEKVHTVHKTVLIWGGLIVIHYLFYLNARKKSNDN
jgi:hypothetical protein